MIYGAVEDTGRGYLKFDHGLVVKLSPHDVAEFDRWVKSRILADRDKQSEKINYGSHYKTL